MFFSVLEDRKIANKKASRTKEELEIEFEEQEKEYKRQIDESLRYLQYLEQKKAELNSIEYENQYDFDANTIKKERDEAIAKKEQLLQNYLNQHKQAELLKKYGDEYVRLYDIYEHENLWHKSDRKIEFVELEKDVSSNILTQEEYFELNAYDGATKDLAIKVNDTETNSTFYVGFHDDYEPGNDEKISALQIRLEEDNVISLNNIRREKLYDFLAENGSYIGDVDIPRNFDGSIDVEGAKQLVRMKEEETKRVEAFNNKEYENIESATKEFLKESGKQEVLSTESNNLTDGKNSIESIFGQDIVDVPDSKEAFEIIKEDTLKDIILRKKSSLPQFNTSNQATHEYAQVVDTGKILNNPTDTQYSSVDQSTQQTSQNIQSANQNVSQIPNQGNQNSKNKSQSDFEEELEKWLTNGLKKRKGLSYFKGRTKGWTRFVVYKDENPDNYKKDGLKDKNGNAKFTYAFKVWLKVDEDGRKHFAYRMNDGKPLDKDTAGDLAGVLSDAGVTHLAFPDGIANCDRMTFLEALAKKGIIPVGVSLDKAKAEVLIEAAKKKLSAEKFAKYKYKLALQMEKYNTSKGKKIDQSEQDFINSLKKSHDFAPLLDGYNCKMKGMLSKILDDADQNALTGALEKVAVYKAIRKVFDAYVETVDGNDYVASTIFTDKEKSELRMLGLAGDPQKLTAEDFGKILDVILVGSKKEAKDELDQALMDARDKDGKKSKGAKRADNIICKEIFDATRARFERFNEVLASMMVSDEISFPKSFGRLRYELFQKEHPEYGENTNTSDGTMHHAEDVHMSSTINQMLNNNISKEENIKSTDKPIRMNSNITINVNQKSRDR